MRAREEDLEWLEQLSDLLTMGIPLERVGAILVNNHRRGRGKRWSEALKARLETGEDLAGGLIRIAGLLNPIEATQLKASWKSGDLKGGLEELIKERAVSIEVRRDMVNAMVYPGMVLMTSICILSFMNQWVMPQMHRFIHQFKSETALPALTVYMMDFSRWGPVLLVITLSLIGGIYAFITHGSQYYVWIGNLRWNMLRRFPFVGTVYRKQDELALGRLLGGLLGSGVAIREAIELLKEMEMDKFKKQQWGELECCIMDGMGMAESVSKQFELDETVRQRLIVGEASGTFAESLEAVALRAREDLRREIEKRIRWIGPSMILGISGFVGLLMLSILLPMVAILENLSQF